MSPHKRHETETETVREADIRPRALFSRYLEVLREDIDRFFADRSAFVEVACVGCGVNNAEAALEKFGFCYVACRECGSLYLSPRPSPEMLSEYHKGSGAARFWATDFYRETAEARRREIFRPRANFVRDLVASGEAKPGTIVDVGSGYGVFLEEVTSHGLFCETVGVEPAAKLATVCRERGFRIIEKPVETIAEGELKAEVVTAFEILEHVANPWEFLTAIRRILSAGGVMLLTTLTASGFDIQVLWEHSKSICPPQHINFLSLEGLQRLVSRAGLDLAELATPGRLDVEIVANALAEDPNLPVPRVVRSVLERGSAAREEFQVFLQRHHLSSHVRVVARARDGGCT